MAKPRKPMTAASTAKRLLDKRDAVLDAPQAQEPDVASLLASGVSRVPVVGPYLSEVVNPPEAGRGSELQGSEFGTEERTPYQENFRKWFKNSQVVDPQGEPLVVYHAGSFDETSDIPEGPMHFGTLAAAQMRQVGKAKEEAAMNVETYQDDSGLWQWDDGFTTSEDLGLPGYDDEETALTYGQSYAMDAVEENPESVGEGNITKAYLSIQNMKRVPDVGGSNGEWEREIEKAKKEGYDGIIYRNKFEDVGSDSYLIFDPTQIKSVENRGTFDPGNPDILSAIQQREPTYG